MIKLTEYSLTSVYLNPYLLVDYNVSFPQKETNTACGELLIADEAIQRLF